MFGVFIQSKNKCGGHFVEVIYLHPSIVSLVQRRVSRTVTHGIKGDNLPDINFWDNSSRFPYLYFWAILVMMLFKNYVLLLKKNVSKLCQEYTFFQRQI